ncbi:MAG: iron-sulfur cluster insertion protein ErpA [Acidobacteria bacterium]|jgi:iron-sulfur cluster insertion protein|nr:iron-sulfur cluster insertion protein ErpA [Acidobacteriota bacterium]
MSTNPTKTSETENVPAPGGEMLVLTPAAVKKLLVYQSENPEFQGKSFRIFIEGGGCSGFRYGFGFDDASEDDWSFEAGGLNVTVDPMSMQYLQGATVDFVDDLSGSGFLVKNPNAKTSCGCGSSFGG